MNYYRQTLDVVVESESHNKTLVIAKSIKSACSAWCCEGRFGSLVEYTEYKSARVGSVLRRDIIINHEGSLQAVMDFQQILCLLCMHLGLTLSVRYLKPLP